MDKFLVSIALVLGMCSAVAQATEPEWVRGTVVKTDITRSKVTLKHERIKSIRMDAMTMPFKVHDAAMLQSLKPGDKVRFTVVNDGGELLVSGIKAAP